MKFSYQKNKIKFIAIDYKDMILMRIYRDFFIIGFFVLAICANVSQIIGEEQIENRALNDNSAIENVSNDGETITGKVSFDIYYGRPYYYAPCYYYYPCRPSFFQYYYYPYRPYLYGY